MMIMDVSFIWQQDGEVEDVDTRNNAISQEHGEFDITRPVAILKLADEEQAFAVLSRHVISMR
jgi:hypothetical protein